MVDDGKRRLNKVSTTAEAHTETPVIVWPSSLLTPVNDDDASRKNKPSHVSKRVKNEVQNKRDPTYALRENVVVTWSHILPSSKSSPANKNVFSFENVPRRPHPQSTMPTKVNVVLLFLSSQKHFCSPCATTAHNR
ncbi:unnamed protein product, partial [Ectocarpus fasciculatus]